TRGGSSLLTLLATWTRARVDRASPLTPAAQRFGGARGDDGLIEPTPERGEGRACVDARLVLGGEHQPAPGEHAPKGGPRLLLARSVERGVVERGGLGGQEVHQEAMAGQRRRSRADAAA